ncbi:MAG: CapA family protein, partial [Myxococcota bacterium]
LERQGLSTIGAGPDQERAYAPHIYPVGDGGGCIAILPAVLWSNRPVRGPMQLAQYNPLHDGSEQALADNVRAARQRCGFVAVYIHWGLEFRHQPHRAMVELGHRMVEAGAGLVVGHHPHVLQGVEFVGRSAIVYSLGNFVFPNTKRHSKPDMRTSGVLMADIQMHRETPYLDALSLVPTIIEPRNIAPVPLDAPVLQQRLRDDLHRWSHGFGTQVELEDGVIHFEPPRAAALVP